jgi:hypothetical protein
LDELVELIGNYFGDCLLLLLLLAVTGGEHHLQNLVLLQKLGDQHALEIFLMAFLIHGLDLESLVIAVEARSQRKRG